MTSRTASESRRSAIAVDPFRSLKRIVTVFRTSGGAGAEASGVPQKPQSRNRSGFSSPQFGQRTITPVRGYLPADVVSPDPTARSGPDIAPGERLDITLLRVSENGMQQCVVASGFTGGSYGLDRWQANIPRRSAQQLLQVKAARPAPVGDDQRRLVRRERRTGTGGRVA